MKKHQISENMVSLVEESMEIYNEERDFVTLDCWKEARNLVKNIYNIAEGFDSQFKEIFDQAETVRKLVDGLFRYLRNYKSMVV